MARKTEKVENLEISTVGRGYGKKLKITENEKYTLQYVKYGKKN